MDVSLSWTLDPVPERSCRQAVTKDGSRSQGVSLSRRACRRHVAQLGVYLMETCLDVGVRAKGS